MLLLVVFEIVLLVDVQVTEKVQFCSGLQFILPAIDENELNIIMGGGQNDSFGLRHEIGFNDLNYEIMMVVKYQEIH